MVYLREANVEEVHVVERAELERATEVCRRSNVGLDQVIRTAVYVARAAAAARQTTVEYGGQLGRALLPLGPKETNTRVRLVIAGHRVVVFVYTALENYWITGLKCKLGKGQVRAVFCVFFFFKEIYKSVNANAH